MPIPEAADESGVADDGDDGETSGEFESISSSDEKSSSSPLARNISILRRPAQLSNSDRVQSTEDFIPLRRSASSPHSVRRSSDTAHRAGTLSSSGDEVRSARLAQILSHRMAKDAGGNKSILSVSMRGSLRLGCSAVFDDENPGRAQISVRAYDQAPLTERITRVRRASLSAPADTGTSTLIAYSADYLGLSPRRLFCVPNAQIDPYMRRCLMSAHASSKPGDVFQDCTCPLPDGAPVCIEHGINDLSAKFVAVYVLDASVPIKRHEHRHLLTMHNSHKTALSRGAWAGYEIAGNATNFVATPVTYFYLIHMFV